MKPGQKSPVSHLLETSSQITWKISLEVNIINHISYPFLKLPCLLRSDRTATPIVEDSKKALLLILQPLISELLCLLGDWSGRHFLQNFHE